MNDANELIEIDDDKIGEFNNNALESLQEALKDSGVDNSIVEVSYDKSVVTIQVSDNDSPEEIDVKKNIEFLANNTREACALLIELGKATQQVRFFETAARMFESLLSANNQLLAINKTRREQKGSNGLSPRHVENLQVNNYGGETGGKFSTTADLIKKKK